MIMSLPSPTDFCGFPLVSSICYIMFCYAYVSTCYYYVYPSSKVCVKPCYTCCMFFSKYFYLPPCSSYSLVVNLSRDPWEPRIPQTKSRNSLIKKIILFFSSPLRDPWNHIEPHWREEPIPLETLNIELENPYQIKEMRQWS